MLTYGGLSLALTLSKDGNKLVYPTFPSAET